MSHTPGPWYAEEPAGGYSAIRYGAGLVFSVAHPAVEFGDPPMSDETKNANLALAADAPDLLKSLKSAVLALRSYQYGNSSTELAKEIADACEVFIRRHS